MTATVYSKTFTAQRPDTCTACGRGIAVGQECTYQRPDGKGRGELMHHDCIPPF
jgi:hypothetical protein